MERLQKDETLDDELDEFREYGFNVDTLVDMLNDDDDETDDEEE